MDSSLRIFVRNNNRLKIADRNIAYYALPKNYRFKPLERKLIVTKVYLRFSDCIKLTVKESFQLKKRGIMIVNHTVDILTGTFSMELKNLANRENIAPKAETVTFQFVTPIAPLISFLPKVDFDVTDPEGDTRMSSSSEED